MSNAAAIVAADEYVGGKWPVRLLPGIAGATVPGGVPFLPDELVNAKLIIQIAFGADLSQPSGTWPWVDVSTDVVQDSSGQMASIVIGAPNESPNSVPASLALTLKNQTAKYSSHNPMSPNWPNVRQGTPIWIQVYVADQFYTRFEGEITGFTPDWDTTGNYAVAIVNANGVLRRLGQGITPLRSALSRGIGGIGLIANVLYTLPNSRPMLYYPFEDGSNATSAAEFNGGPSLGTKGTVTWAATNTGLPGSDLLPTFAAGSNVTLKVPNYTATNAWRIEFAFSFPVTAAANTNIITWKTSGATANNWQFRYVPASGLIFLQAVNNLGVDLLLDPGYPVPVAIPLDTVIFVVINMTLNNTGTGVSWSVQLTSQTPTGPVSSQFSATTAAFVPGVLKSITVAPDVNMDGMAFGHLAPFNTTEQFTNPNGFFQVDYLYALGYAGYQIETTRGRLVRLTTEQGIALTTTGGGADTQAMGPQGVDTFVSLLRECELTGGGMIYDGLTQGISYQRLSDRYNQTPLLSLNAASELIPPFNPIDDDFGRVNLMKVDRKNGSSATFTDATGPMGTAAIGTYDSTLPTPVNPFDDSTLYFRASWEVHKGTIPGLRYPTINLNLRKIPGKIVNFLGCLPGTLISITPPYTAQHPIGDLVEFIEGWQEVIGPRRWEVTLNLSRGRGFDVFTIGDSRLGKIETGGASPVGASSLTADVAIGATSFSVASAGVIWTRNSVTPSDFPFSVEISGIQVSVTGVAGTSSPQTFSCNSDQIVKTLHAGDSVKLWHPGVIKLY